MLYRNTPWLVRRAPRDGAKLRLFCFPHAGAGSVIFRDWFAAFPATIDVCAVEPPGRLARRKERAYRDLGEFTQALVSELAPYLDRPFALFGYSLGSLMAFECARALRTQHGLQPANLIVAAHKAPHKPFRHRTIGHESAPVFVRELERRYGPLEPMIKADPEMLAVVVEMMRTDLGMVENYRYRADAPLACPILALGGSQDLGVDASELEAWREHTLSTCRVEWFAGGHFFLREHAARLRALVESEILCGPLFPRRGAEPPQPDAAT